MGLINLVNYSLNDLHNYNKIYEILNGNVVYQKNYTITDSVFSSKTGKYEATFQGQNSVPAGVDGNKNNAVIDYVSGPYELYMALETANYTNEAITFVFNKSVSSQLQVRVTFFNH